MNKQWRSGVFAILILSLTILAHGAPVSQAQQNNPAYLGVQVVVNDQGTQIVQVIPGSPAETAGLKPGDLIIAIDDQALSSGNSLDTILSRFAPDTLIQVGIVRNGQPMQLNVILGARPAGTAAPSSPLAATAAPASGGQTTITLITPGAPTSAANPAISTPASTADSPLGSTVPLPAASTAAAGAESTIPPAGVPTIVPATASGSAAFMGVRLVDLRQGAQITAILPGSPADTAGLMVGDWILAVDNQPVQLAGQVQAILNQKAVGASLVIHFQRGAQMQDVTVQLVARPASANGPRAGITPVPGTTPGAQSAGAQAAGASFPAFGFVTRVEPQGLRVFSTTPDGPADQGGLRAGDLIIQVGAATVNLLDLTPVIVQLAAAQPAPVSLVVVRGGSTMTLQLQPVPGAPATPSAPATGTAEA